MKELFKDSDIKRNIFTYTISGLLIFIGLTIIKNISNLNSFFSSIFSVLAPFIWGLIFVFFLKDLANKIEEKLPSSYSFKQKRAISTIVSLLVLLLVIVSFIWLIVPQIMSSISPIADKVVSFTKNSPEWLADLIQKFNLNETIVKTFNNDLAKVTTTVINFIQTSIPNLINTTVSTIKGIFNFIIGIIVCVYVLSDREHLVKQIKMIFLSLFSNDFYNKLVWLHHLSQDKLSSFFFGKLIDSAIVGVICYVVMLVLKLEYPLLISLIIGVTNIIPCFGPFIGAVPSALILLIESPSHALVFLVFIVVLQQIDGNIIGPKILGDSVGLSSLWITFSIIVFGYYFGFIGMLLGVPVFSIVYEIVKKLVYERLDKKGISKDDEILN